MLLHISLLTVMAITPKNVYGDREHKVHNIVLYPDRHSWCQTTPIKQIVAMPGFEPMTIDNNVCVGACYSYSIPRTEPAEPGELIGPYCDSCQPLETKCYHVTLQSESQENEPPKTIQKRVQIITNCSCSSCNKHQSTDCEITDANTSELPTNLFSLLHLEKPEKKQEQEVPELLNLAPPKNRSMALQQLNTTTNEQRYEINSKLINLLKSIQNQEDDDDSNLNYDKGQLKELLDIIEGSEHQLSDKNLMDFVNFVNVHNSEDLELDLSRLKEVLENFRRERDLLEKHRDFGLGNLGAKNNADINADLAKKYIPKNFGIEGSHLGMGHLKGSHIGMGLQTNLENTLGEAKVAHHKTDDTKIHKKPEETGTKGHHHLGEVQHLGTKLGHLIQGPHGSLIVTPDNINIEEKLNLNSDEIRPNHEGAVISYENHHRIHHGHHKLQSPDF